MPKEAFCSLRRLTRASLSSPRRATHAMSAVPSASASTFHSKFSVIFNTALEKYKRKTRQDLAKHPLLPKFQSCDSPETILAVLREQIPTFGQWQDNDNELTKWVTPTVNVLYSFSGTLGGVVGLVNIGTFPLKINHSNIYPSGIPTSEHNLHRDRSSPPG